jgi:hypothetical protein
VTDALDRLAEPGAHLLERVDAILLASGLPAGHPITGLLRRLGALPTDAMHAICAQQPAPLRAAATEARRLVDGYERQRDLIAAPAGWAGAAGERFGAHRETVVAYLDGAGERGVIDRLRSTAACLDELAEWMGRSRLGMARAVADVLGSAEVVHLCATGDAAAAATIGARVLTAADDAHTAGRELADRWRGRLDELAYRPPGSGKPAAGGIRLAF